LRPYPVDRILSSPTDRCRQTVEPLARQRRLPIELHGALAVDGTAEGLLALLRDDALRGAVLCTHGELIGQVFERLLAGGLRLPGEPRWQKGSVWVLGGPDGRLSQASYIAPAAASRPA
jgi:8-oxo-dGTP diphosphatase